MRGHEHDLWTAIRNCQGTYLGLLQSEVILTALIQMLGAWTAGSGPTDDQSPEPLGRDGQMGLSNSTPDTPSGRIKVDRASEGSASALWVTRVRLYQISASRKLTGIICHPTVRLLCRENGWQKEARVMGTFHQLPCHLGLLAEGRAGTRPAAAQ